MRQAGALTIPRGEDVAPTDEILVERARAGSTAACDELFQRSQEVAYRIALRLLGRHDDALDAVQDAAVKAFLHLSEFDGRSRFRTWFLRIVTNAARDLGRRRARRAMVRLADPGTGEGPEPAVDFDPSTGLHRADLRRRLDAALARLSPAIRETFVLRAEAELSYEEIAQTQGVPIGTVMSRLHYARQKLQAMLGDLPGLD